MSYATAFKKQARMSLSKPAQLKFPRVKRYKKMSVPKFNGGKSRPYRKVLG